MLFLHLPLVADTGGEAFPFADMGAEAFPLATELPDGQGYSVVFVHLTSFTMASGVLPTVGAWSK